MVFDVDVDTGKPESLLCECRFASEYPFGNYIQNETLNGLGNSEQTYVKSSKYWMGRMRIEEEKNRFFTLYVENFYVALRGRARTPRTLWQ